MLSALDHFKEYIQSSTDLSDDDFMALSACLKTKKVAKNEFILRPGEVCNYSIFVATGLLKSYTIDANGKEHIIQFAPENWIITDRSSSFFNKPSQLFINAIEDAEIILTDKFFFDALADKNAAFRTFNTNSLHSHIRHLQNRVNLLLGASAEERYLDFIKLYPSLTLRIPQWMIASYLGITPESLSRVRKELAKRNFKPQH